MCRFSIMQMNFNCYMARNPWQHDRHARASMSNAVSVTNESQNHYKENSTLSANLLLIIAPALQPPEETTSSRSQNKVDYMYNLSLRALCAFACVKAVPEAIFVGRRNPRTPPYIFLITVRR